MAKLTEEFFLRDTVTVAQDLLGRYLVRTLGEDTIVCRITETEAYVGATDKACHAYGGRVTERTRTLYAMAGSTYVYLIYGLHCCLNFVTEPEGTAAAVLLRGCEPVYNTELASTLRFGVKTCEMTAYQRKNFMNGPAKLCKALSIDRCCNGLTLGNDTLYLADKLPEFGLPCRDTGMTYSVGKRIGIDYAEEARDFPWRFWI